MSIFDKEVRLPGVSGAFGTEPSIRKILVKYYRQAFDDVHSENLADEYIKAITSEIGEDE